MPWLLYLGEHSGTKCILSEIMNTCVCVCTHEYGYMHVWMHVSLCVCVMHVCGKTRGGSKMEPV